MDYEEGDKCSKPGCEGVLSLSPQEGCSCHINPPCADCTSRYLLCPECGWEEPKTEYMNGYVMKVDRKTGRIFEHKLRELDRTKIDWHTFSHTHFTQKCEGVYPEGTTMDQVQAKVNGTFGGRFDSFRDGKFVFIAYTD